MRTRTLLAIVTSVLLNCRGKNATPASLSIGVNDLNGYISSLLMKEHMHSRMLKENENVRVSLDSSAMALSFSVPLNPHDFIKGDLNGDNDEDIIVEVKEFEGSTCRRAIYYSFFYTSQGNYAFARTFDSHALDACNSQADLKSNFYITKIINGNLIGMLECYLGGRALCCPSSRKETTMKFTDIKDLNSVAN